MRVQNEGTGKSSWWMINPDAKPGKAARRRAISMETQNYEKRRGRVRRRVEQYRAGLMNDPNPLATLSEYPKSSDSLILSSSNVGGSNYKLTGSATSLLSSNVSLSNLNISDSGPAQGNQLIVASPSSTESFDFISESTHNLANPFHTNHGNFSPGEFRPRASSNASSTSCSTANLLIDSSENHQVGHNCLCLSKVTIFCLSTWQVSPISPLNWNNELIYNSGSNAFVDQSRAANSYRNSSSSNDAIHLIDCLNLGTRTSPHNSSYQMIVDDCPLPSDEEQQIMHKNGGSMGCHNMSHESVNPDMMLLGGNMSNQHISTLAHNYNDLYKIHPTTTVASTSPSSSAVSPKAYTTLDTTPAKGVNASSNYYKMNDTLTSQPVNTTAKVHEINNNNNNGLSINAYGSNMHSQRSQSLTMSPFTFYQSLEASHLQCYDAEYATDSNYNGYYGGQYQLSDSLNNLSFATHQGLDVDFDAIHTSQLDCDVDQVIRHELNMDGSLDFSLANNATNVDTTSTSTKPSTAHSQSYSVSNNVDGLNTVDHRHQRQSEQQPDHSPGSQPTLMDISSYSGPQAHSQSPYYSSPNVTNNKHSSYASMSPTSTSNNTSPVNIRLTTLTSPTANSYSAYPKFLPVNSHFAPAPNSTTAAVVAAEAVSATVTSVPATATSHHQPVASQSWVH